MDTVRRRRVHLDTRSRIHIDYRICGSEIMSVDTLVRFFLRTVQCYVVMGDTDRKQLLRSVSQSEGKDTDYSTRQQDH